MKKIVLTAAFIGIWTLNNAQEAPTSVSQAELLVYEAPAEAPSNSTFSVFVRYEGGEWIDLHEYDAPVDGGFDQAPSQHMAFVYFDSDFSKRIDMRVIRNTGTIDEVQIRPQSAGVEAMVEADTITFSLTEPCKISVEVNQDLYNNLMVFANSLETEPVDPNDTLVHYFGPGVHMIGGDGKGSLSVKSNETVYIAGGAIVYGHIAIADPSYQAITNATVRGRGILSGDMRDSHAFNHPEHGSTPALITLNIVNDARVEGIILHNTVTWNVHMHYCQRIEVRDLKIMSWTINSDGIDPQVSSDVLIDDCFVRNHDDCVSIKLSWFQGGIQARGARNITIQNSIFWTDQGRAVLIGPELASSSDKVVENVTVRNMDILYTENYSSANTEWAKGVLAINAGDDATVRNIVYEDIRVDRLGSKTNLITLNMVQTPFSGSQGQRIENIIFNRVSLNSLAPMNNHIHGFSSERMISGVHFKDLSIEGVKVTSAEEGYFDINTYAEDITFSTSEDDLIARWRFEGDASDDYGIAHGNPEGHVSYSTDAKQGRHSLLLEGDGYLNCLDPGPTNHLEELTVALWFKTTEDVSEAMGLIEKGYEFRLVVEDNKVHFVVATENVGWYSEESWLKSDTPITPGTWYHVAGVYDGSTTRIYLNGEPDTVNSHAITGATADMDQPLQMGYMIPEFPILKGQLDDVRLYGRALDAAAVRELYHSDTTLETRVNRLTDNDPVSVYPNPAGSILVVGQLEAGSELALYSMSGKQLLRTRSDGRQHTLKVGHLPAGIYLLRVERKDTNVVRKIVLER
ncbi:MAG: LamG-like jellyroll fold domain-containing protein [Bacteroidota bacterium]